MMDINLIKLARLYKYLFTKFDNIFYPIFLIVIRYKVFKVFFYSGKLKLKNLFEDKWDLTVALFRYEHPIPFLSAEIAAILATFNEILFPILILIGLLSRLSAVVLLIMTIIIEFTYQHSDSHLLWGVILIIIILKGVGKFSLDTLFVAFIEQKAKKICKR